MNPQPMFVTWDDGDKAGKAAALATAGRAYSSGANIQPRMARAANTAFRNISGSGSSVRDGFDRRDYDYFRPGERIPTDPAGIIGACMQAYDKFPLVYNTINLMSDFACKGIDIVHPNPRVEKFGKEWAKRVDMTGRTERIASMLLRAGTTVINRKTGRLPDRTLDVLRAKAAKSGVPVIKPPVKLKPGEIPLEYTVLDPRTLTAIGGELAPFVGHDCSMYALEMSRELIRKIKNPKGAEEQAMVGLIPQAIRSAVQSGKTSITLEKEKTAAIHYKKDDHQVWARPLLYPLLDSLSMFDKFRMGDRAALDGAVSHIRLWRLGSLEHRIFPNAEAVQKLAEMLLNNGGGGSMDLIWGPELDFKETTSDLHKWLGIEKYIPILQEIFIGLGIPPSLNGTVGKESGFTNNMVSLKTFVERLQYIRNLITKFWATELAIVQSVMGFKNPFTLTFDDADLSDQSAYLKLLTELCDRDIISAEFVQEQFGAVPEIENLRVRREWKERKSGARPPKASPFHIDAQQEPSLERIYAQTGVLTPSELGLETQPRKPGEASPAETMSKLKVKEIKAAPAPAPGQPGVGGVGGGSGANPKKPAGQSGRPKGAKDTGKRKTKVVKPRSKAAADAYTDAMLLADRTLREVADVTTAAYLETRGKKNLRQLTAAEAEEFERFKFALACRYGEGERVTEETVAAKVAESPLALPAPVDQLYQETRARLVAQEGKEPTVERERQIRVMVLALWKADLDGPQDEAGVAA